MLREWSLTTGRQRRQRYLGEVEPLWAFRPDGERLAAAGQELVVFDCLQGQELARVRPQEWITALAWSADGKWLATGHDDGRVCVWESEHLRVWRQMRLGREAISALAFSGDGELLAVADEARRLVLYSRFAGDLLMQWHPPSGRVAALVWHPHLTWLVSAGWDTHAHLWKPAEAEPVALFNAHDECVTALAISPDGSVLATGDSAGCLRLWSFDNRRLLHEVAAGLGELTLLAFDALGHRLLSGGEERRLLVWEVASGKVVLGCGGGAAGARIRLGWNETEGLVALAAGRRVCIFDGRGDRPARQLDHPHGATCLTWAETPQLLFTGDAMGGIHRWAADAAQWQGCWQEHRTAITDLAWEPETQRLASAGGSDGYVYLWALTQESPILLIPEATSGATTETVRFVPQYGGLLVGGVDWLAERQGAGALVYWNRDDWAPRVLLRQGVLRLAVRHDGQYALAANLHGTVWLLELPSGRILAELAGHSEPVLALAFHPRTAEILTASEDHLVCVWSPSGSQLAATDVEISVHDAVFSASGEYVFTANGNQTVFQMESSALGFGKKS
uniref:WD-40 repeat-containing protein n=1 Tax=uncultured Planctomycetota bacterium TaxID=120965 RepID=H5SCD1_9BACT|nr:WD-40 repeat-containing protein [uncultured Planctomycetota bacterium]